MVDPWELILHHSYTGTAGVIFDRSPDRGSHGMAVNLADSAFSADGARTGSGSVSFENGGTIQVAASDSWHPIGGLRAEVVLRRNQQLGSFDTVYDAGTFDLVIRGGNIYAFFMGSGSHFLSLRSPDSFETPAGQWITIAVLYDGVSTARLWVDGQLVATATERLWPVVSPAGLTIGANSAGGLGLNGRLDDVKIWRLNPHRVSDEFTRRPGIGECWADWARQFQAAIDQLRQEDPECPARIAEMIAQAVQSQSAEALTGSPQSSTRWRQASADYRRLWLAGDIAGIGPVIADLLASLQSEGIDLSQNPHFQELTDNSCWQRLIELLPPLTCDPDFAGLFTQHGKA